MKFENFKFDKKCELTNRDVYINKEYSLEISINNFVYFYIYDIYILNFCIENLQQIDKILEKRLVNLNRIKEAAELINSLREEEWKNY